MAGVITSQKKGLADGFTLVELLIVIVILGILAALLLPALSHTKQKGVGVYCLNNGRQMMAAMTMYGNDYNEYFPPNPDDGNTISGYNWCSGRAGAGGSAEFNPDILADPLRCLIAPFLNGNVSVFHCPADKRTGLYQGADPNRIGSQVSAARTFSMNQAVGTIDPGFDLTGNSSHIVHSGAPILSVNGPWLDNRHQHRRDSPWSTYGRFSDINSPGPSMLWVLVDEDTSNLNDAAFAFGMEQPVWYDVPGSYHNGGCGFAFADGHSESHQWMSKSPKSGGGNQIENQLDLQDWSWMQARTSANLNPTNTVAASGN